MRWIVIALAGVLMTIAVAGTWRFMHVRGYS